MKITEIITLYLQNNNVNLLKSIICEHDNWIMLHYWFMTSVFLTTVITIWRRNVKTNKHFKIKKVNTHTDGTKEENTQLVTTYF